MSTSNGRKSEPFDAVLRPVLVSNPDPPRPAPMNDLVRASYGSTSGKSIAIAGAVIVLSSAPLFAQATEDALYLGFALPMVSFGMLLLVVPTLPARSAARAIRDGIQVLGEVTRISYRPPGDARTIDAIRNGSATGLRRVAHPRGAFDDQFETDASWARRLRPGSRMLLLADPLDQRVMLDMGPAEESATLSESGPAHRAM